MRLREDSVEVCRETLINRDELAEVLEDLCRQLNSTDSFRLKSVQGITSHPHLTPNRRGDMGAMWGAMFGKAPAKKYVPGPKTNWMENPRYVITQFLEVLIRMLRFEPVHSVLNKFQEYLSQYENQYPDISFKVFLGEVKFEKMLREAIFLETIEDQKTISILRYRIRGSAMSKVTG